MAVGEALSLELTWSYGKTAQPLSALLSLVLALPVWSMLGFLVYVEFPPSATERLAAGVTPAACLVGVGAFKFARA